MNDLVSREALQSLYRSLDQGPHRYAVHTALYWMHEAMVWESAAKESGESVEKLRIQIADLMRSRKVTP
jgi:hypothetical protein